MRSKTRKSGVADVITLAKSSMDPRTGLMVEDAKLISEGSLKKPYDNDAVLLVYKINTYHQRCIRVKARMTCGLGYELIGKKDVSEATVNKERKLFEEFEKQHAQRALQPFAETLVNFQTDYEIFGNGYLEAVRSRDGKTVADLVHIPSRSAGIIRKKINNVMTVMLEQEVNGKKVQFRKFGAKEPKESNEYLHLKDYYPESIYYGYPEYLSSLATMLLDRAAVTYNAKRFSNDLMLQTILFIAGWKMDSEALKKARQFFKREFKGLEAESSALLLSAEDKDAKIEVKTVGSEQKDSSFRMLRMDNKEEVVDAHGVPRRIVGLTTPGKLGDASQTREEMKIFRDISIQPRQNKIEFIFNTIILPQMGITNCDFKLKTMDLSDDVADAQYYDTLVSAGIIDADEARTPLGFGERVNKSAGNGVLMAKELLNLRDVLVRVKGML